MWQSRIAKRARKLSSHSSSEPWLSHGLSADRSTPPYPRVPFQVSSGSEMRNRPTHIAQQVGQSVRHGAIDVRAKGQSTSSTINKYISWGATYTLIAAQAASPAHWGKLAHKDCNAYCHTGVHSGTSRGMPQCNANLFVGMPWNMFFD